MKVKRIYPRYYFIFLTIGDQFALRISQASFLPEISRGDVPISSESDHNYIPAYSGAEGTHSRFVLPFLTLVGVDISVVIFKVKSLIAPPISGKSSSTSSLTSSPHKNVQSPLPSSYFTSSSRTKLLEEEGIHDMRPSYVERFLSNQGPHLGFIWSLKLLSSLSLVAVGLENEFNDFYAKVLPCFHPLAPALGIALCMWIIFSRIRTLRICPRGWSLRHW